MVRAAKEPASVFVSYSHRDGETVRRILGDVSKNLPIGRFFFWDHTRIAPGSNPGADVAEALDSSSAMLVFVSPDYFASDWGRRELEYALASKRYAGRVIPVLIQRTPDAPWILERLGYIDATDSEPSTVGKEIAKALRSPGGSNE